MSELIARLSGRWVSTRIVGPLKHESNFSNWIGAWHVPGLVRFELDPTRSPDDCAVLLPTVDESRQKGYVNIHRGKFGLEGAEILIWQNPDVPVRIPFELIEDRLWLTLFREKIEFQKDP